MMPSSTWNLQHNLFINTALTVMLDCGFQHLDENKTPFERSQYIMRNVSAALEKENIKHLLKLFWHPHQNTPVSMVIDCGGCLWTPYGCDGINNPIIQHQIQNPEGFNPEYDVSPYIEQNIPSEEELIQELKLIPFQSEFVHTLVSNFLTTGKQKFQNRHHTRLYNHPDFIHQLKTNLETLFPQHPGILFQILNIQEWMPQTQPMNYWKKRGTQHIQDKLNVFLELHPPMQEYHRLFWNQLLQYTQDIENQSHDLFIQPQDSFLLSNSEANLNQNNHFFCLQKVNLSNEPLQMKWLRLLSIEKTIKNSLLILSPNQKMAYIDYFSYPITQTLHLNAKTQSQFFFPTQILSQNHSIEETHSWGPMNDAQRIYTQTYIEEQLQIEEPHKTTPNRF